MKKAKQCCPVCNKILQHKDGFYSCKTKNCTFDAEENLIFGHWGDVFTNPGDTEMDIIDSAGQCLRFRVGPVFGKEILKSPGIWISYQEKYQKTELKGDFLMSAETWKVIKNQIDNRIKTFNAKAYSFKVKKK